MVARNKKAIGASLKINYARGFLADVPNKDRIGAKINFKGGFLPQSKHRRTKGKWIDTDGTDQPETGKFGDSIGNFSDYI